MMASGSDHVAERSRKILVRFAKVVARAYVGEYVHAARDHAVDLLLDFAAEVGSECRRSIEKPSSG